MATGLAMNRPIRQRLPRVSFSLMVSLVLVAAAACTYPPADNGGGPAVGCYRSVSGGPDLRYDGPMGGVASYWNATAFASRDGSCSLGASSSMTLVMASSAPTAITACHAGPDAMATTATNPSSNGYPGLSSDVWACSNALAGALPVTPTCFDHNSEMDIGYHGPRNTVDNAIAYLSTDRSCAGVFQSVTVVFQSDPTSARSLCASLRRTMVLEPPFTGPSGPAGSMWVCV